MIVKMYRDHTPPCIRLFSLISIHDDTVYMYACLIYECYYKLICFRITLCYACVYQRLVNTRKQYAPSSKCALNNHVRLTTSLYGMLQLSLGECVYLLLASSYV